MLRGKKRMALSRPDATGEAPGTLQAPASAATTILSALAYGPDGLVEIEDLSPGDLPALRRDHPVVWVRMTGLSDVTVLGQVGEALGLHRLALEDAVNIPQRTKFDDYGDHQFLTARLPISATMLDTEQLGLFLGEGFVFTVQEKESQAFTRLQERLNNPRGRLRTSGADYLAYALVDTLVDTYFPLLEITAQQLEELELAMMSGGQGPAESALHDVGQVTIILRRYLVPLREALSLMVREDSPYFTPGTQVYLRDCLDHARQAADLVESYRDTCTNLMNLHLSLLSQKMNEVMKVLTIIATIFIPLSFLVGLYGMNFDREASRWNMPELGFAYGYPVLLGIMFALVAGMLFWFRRQGWFR